MDPLLTLRTLWLPCLSFLIFLFGFCLPDGGLFADPGGVNILNALASLLMIIYFGDRLRRRDTDPDETRLLRLALVLGGIPFVATFFYVLPYFGINVLPFHPQAK